MATCQQMLFLVGPRQVGKTTLSKLLKNLPGEFHYLDWDVDEDRLNIMQGQKTLGTQLLLDRVQPEKPTIVFDEIHKHSAWKNYLKGFYDLYADDAHIIVTGSARLDVYQSGGDSLMGRYFSYHVHPLSIAEITNPTLNETGPRSPSYIDDSEFDRLWQFGGFPAPYAKHNISFYARWKNARNKQLFREDIRDIMQIHDVARMELLAELLKLQIGQLINRNSLAKKIGITAMTVSSWLTLLKRVFYCFSIKPWHKNISRSLIKEPKYYLWDWSLLEDKGAKAENFVASHLLKAVHCWNDRGLGEYDLHFVRDKDKNEVDFLVVKNQEPWMLVEVKYSDNEPLSPALKSFQKQLNAPYAFQVVIDLPYVDVDCFQCTRPMIVPAKTLLSQLV